HLLGRRLRPHPSARSPPARIVRKAVVPAAGLGTRFLPAPTWERAVELGVGDFVDQQPLTAHKLRPTAAKFSKAGADTAGNVSEFTSF
ncbi:hypothetical protein CA983_42975, partial [Streptomyces swartbergensis]